VKQYNKVVVIIIITITIIISSCSSSSNISIISHYYNPPNCIKYLTVFIDSDIIFVMWIEIYLNILHFWWSNSHCFGCVFVFLYSSLKQLVCTSVIWNSISSTGNQLERTQQKLAALCSNSVFSKVHYIYANYST
jgi:hypothetical protein